jgi:c-di-GMP-binding flagellar brake protein YcgR
LYESFKYNMKFHKKEKRRHKRYIVDGVQGNILYPSDLEILNISLDGAAIETRKWLDLNREYTLKIKYKDTILNLRGRVVWAILTSKGKRGSEEMIPVYRAGVKFTDILHEKTNILLNFIDDNKVRTLERRLTGVRFKIATPEDAKIDYPYKYEVKKISLSGMLAEIENLLDLNVQYNIELVLNENVLNVVGRVVNCTEIKSESSVKYDVGIEFMKVSDDDRKFLKDFLNTFEDL